MIIAPLFALFMAFVPVPLGLRLYLGVTFGLGLYLIALVVIMIDTDRRAVRAGYVYSKPQAIRTANSVERQRAANHARRERIAARRHTRNSRRRS